MKISKLLVQADELHDTRTIKELRESESILWLLRDSSILLKDDHKSGDVIISVPETGLTRMSQFKIGLFRAVLDKKILIDESVICLSGVSGSKRLDTLFVANSRRNFPWFRRKDLETTRSVIASRHFGRIIDIALRLSGEGREGKPVGTAFILGNPKELEPYLRQLILNPCAGHPERHRNLHREDFLESVREFAALDGAFIVTTKGIVKSAGTYLDVRLKKTRIAPGLGARHASAASITAQTDSVAVVISESSGTVTVFHDGKTILELEKPTRTTNRTDT